ncbi:MAG: hypothetical protein LBU53_07770 [Zoogloeaceae bacterium]|jgi:hypothetical protein|nr:hypothetical protein [Zoogloeaceae bacterium]
MEIQGGVAAHASARLMAHESLFDAYSNPEKLAPLAQVAAQTPLPLRGFSICHFASIEKVGDP